jgi:hypothetical protein
MNVRVIILHDWCVDAHIFCSLAQQITATRELITQARDCHPNGKIIRKSGAGEGGLSARLQEFDAAFGQNQCRR